MRLWTLHPKHLDPVGLVALWREALLAQAVIEARTRGYRQHPQLERFRSAPEPAAAIGAYLRAIAAEADGRGYRFNGSLIRVDTATKQLEATRGQLAYEWDHLGHKLRARNQAWYDARYIGGSPSAHPLFRIVAGPIAPWERVANGTNRAS